MKPKYKVGDTLETKLLIDWGRSPSWGEFKVHDISRGKISNHIYYTDGYGHYYSEENCRLKEENGSQGVHRKDDIKSSM